MKTDIAILGGGLSGIAAGYEASRLGRSIIIVEKENTIGGLSRTIDFNGFRFDLGGHRIHSDSTSLLNWIKQMLGNHYLEVVRKSTIFLNGRRIDYPLKLPRAFTAFGIIKSVLIFLSYMKTQTKLTKRADNNFEDWVVNRFGEELYKIYFEPYTKKLWGLPCNYISKDWASERISFESLSHVIYKSIFSKSNNVPKTYVSQFIYPKLGIGQLCNIICEHINHDAENRILVNTKVVKIKKSTKRSYSILCLRGDKKVSIEAESIISTIPLNKLIAMLSDTVDSPITKIAANLRYRSLICVFLTLKIPRVSSDTWTYLPEQRMSCGRIHEPKNWSPYMAPKNLTSLCAEIFCSEGDKNWNSSDSALVESTVRDLETVGVLPKDCIMGSKVVRVADAYPVFDLSYNASIDKVSEYLNNFSGLFIAGRTGSFQYLNIDTVIQDAFKKTGLACHKN